MSNIHHQPPQSVAQTIEWLHNTLGRPALPECPSECERDCGVPGGKAPAWINRRGKASKVAWTSYQSQLPTQAQLERWFAFTPGIGTLGGGPNNRGHYIGFVDLDRKQAVFSSPEAFEARLQQWLSDYPVLQQSPRFRTPSGGYRVILAFTEKPDWTALSLDPDGPRMGELLARNGGHTLLPPTVGTNGIAYCWEYFVPYPPVVQQPEDVGIYPTRKQRSSLEDNPRPPARYVPGAIPLEDLISSSAKEILLGGALKGSRSDAINALAQESYGWEAFCRRNNIPYSGTTEELVQYAWGQMEDSASDPNKWQRILKTIHSDACQTAAEYRRGDEESCWKKIYRLERATFEDKCPPHIKDRIKAEWATNKRQQSESSRNGFQPEPNKKKNGAVASVGNHSNSTASVETSFDPKILKKKAIHLISLDLSPSDLEAEIATVESDIHIKNFATILDKTRMELEQIDLLDEQFKTVENLLEIEAEDIDITEFIDVPQLANPIKQKAEALSLPQHWYLFSLLSVVSGLLGSKAYLEIDPGLNFKVPPNLWVGLVLDSGDMKSTITSDIVDPLFDLQNAAHEAFLQAERNYEKDSQTWELLSKDEKRERIENDELPPTRPEPVDYMTTDCSKEALVDLLDKNPRGILLYKEELVGFFKSLNQYRLGKGDDTEFFLSLYDQKPYRSHRVSKNTRHLPKPSTSIIGTIQEGVLYEQYGDFSDANGMMARFLWLPAPSQLVLYPRNRPKVHFGDVVVNLYQRIINYFPKPSPDDDEEECEQKRRFRKKFTLSPEAFDLYINQWYDYCAVLAYKTPQKGLKAAIRKLQAAAARIALNLHCLNALATPTGVPFDEISADTMQKAIALAAFCLKKTQMIHTKGAPAVLPGLAPEYLDIIDLSKRCGRIKAKTVQRFGSPATRKLSADEIRRRFRYLAERNLGKTYNSGRHLEYEYAPNEPGTDEPPSPTPPDGRNGRKKVAKAATPQTTVNQGSQKNVAKVATNNGVSSDPSPDETTPPCSGLHINDATATIATNGCNPELVRDTDGRTGCDFSATVATNGCNSPLNGNENGRNGCDFSATASNITVQLTVEPSNSDEVVDAHQPESQVSEEHSIEQPLADSASKEAVLNQPSKPTTRNQQAARKPPPKGRRTNIRVGQMCRYRGPDRVMALTCRGKDLEVLETRTNADGQPEARVKAKAWACDYWILCVYLQKSSQG